VGVVARRRVGRSRHAADGHAGRPPLVGAVLPDLVDKPLWDAGVAATGHTVAHSAVVAGAVAAFLVAVPRL